MKKHNQIIREMIVEAEEDGVFAISLVDEPAIMENFIHFNSQVNLRQVDVGGDHYVDLDEFWKYGGTSPEIQDNSHQFCIDHAVGPKNIFHLEEIRGWGQLSTTQKDGYAFIDNSNFFATFAGTSNASFNIDEQIYNCRHSLMRVRRLNDLIAAGISLTPGSPGVYSYDVKTSPNSNNNSPTPTTTKVPTWRNLPVADKKKNLNEQKRSNFNEIKFKINKEKREIVGPALIPNVMIYRSEIGDTGSDGYVYLSKKTIKTIKEDYGYNRTLTIQHSADITGRAILLGSWIYPQERDETFGINVPEGTWMLKYKIIDEKLWEVIKDQGVLGFSIEGMFNLRDPRADF